jgi:antiphage defense system Thoeris ThsB-like protein
LDTPDWDNVEWFITTDVGRIDFKDGRNMVTETKNVFISHVHEDDNGLENLRNLLSTKGIDIRDSSIHTGKFNDASDPDYIKSQILAPAINWAGTFICYVSPATKGSKWVDWEIEYAAKQGKRIVGVWAHGEKECDIPDALREYADSLVGWHGDAIINAINGEDTWEKPDGGPCSRVPLKRHPC